MNGIFIIWQVIDNLSNLQDRFLQFYNTFHNLREPIFTALCHARL